MNFWIIAHITTVVVSLIATVKFFVRMKLSTPETNIWSGSAFTEESMQAEAWDAFVRSSVRFTLFAFVTATCINMVCLTLLQAVLKPFI